MDAESSVLFELDMCCGRAKCPRARLLSTGALELIDENTGVSLVLTAEQLYKLRHWLKQCDES